MTHLALRFNPLCVDFILVIYCFFLPHRDTNFLVFSIDHTYKVYIGGAQKGLTETTLDQYWTLMDRL